MNGGRAFTAAAFALALMSGCALMPGSDFLPGDLTPLAPNEAASGTTFMQKLAVTTPDGVSHHRIVFTSGAESVQVLILGPMGQRAATFRYNGKQFTSEQRIPYDLPLSGARLMTILQLIGWPAAALESTLPPGWTLSQQGDERLVHHHGRTAARIRYTNGPPPAGRSVYSARDGYDIITQSVRIE